MASKCTYTLRVCDEYVNYYEKKTFHYLIARQRMESNIDVNAQLLAEGSIYDHVLLELWCHVIPHFRKCQYSDKDPSKNTHCIQ